MTPSQLVFIDETWSKTNMTRLYGWALCNQRLIEAIPWGHWKTTTFMAGLRSDGLIAPALFDGVTNGDMFVAYVEQVVVPTLRIGDVVIMDNLRDHKFAGVREGSRRRGRACCSFRPTAPTSI